MKRIAICCAFVLAAMTAACSGDAGDEGSLTGPSSQGGGSQNCSRPGAPGNFVVSVDGTNVMMTWSAVAGAMQYDVLVGTSPSSANVLATNTSNASYPWSGVPRGTYYARVQARNACGTSGSSNEVQFTIAG